MRNNRLSRLMVAIAIVIILIPILVILMWTVTARWPWPNMLPESFTTRTIAELASSDITEVLSSSILLATLVALFSTAIAVMTARATEIYRIRAAKTVSFVALLPLLVPGTAFAMGVQVSLIRMGLNDTIAGVVLVHVIAALPYSILIMLDMTRMIGINHEEQAAVLGAAPTRGFFDASLPQLMPGILSSASMAYIISYSQYFTTLMAGGGKIKTLALVLVPYIQSGDRALSAIYAVVFVGSALLIFVIFELLLHKMENNGGRK